MGCDTFVVLPSHTKGHSVIFGKNSDRPNGEVQEVLYHPAKNSNGETLLKVKLLFYLCSSVMLHFILPFATILDNLHSHTGG